MNQYVALDVETISLSSKNGDRVIEIGAVAIFAAPAKCFLQLRSRQKPEALKKQKICWKFRMI